MELRSGRALLEAIERGGHYNQKTFAEAVGISRGMVNHLVHERERQVSQELAAKICLVLNCRPSELFVVPEPSRQRAHIVSPREADRRATAGQLT